LRPARVGDETDLGRNPDVAFAEAHDDGGVCAADNPVHVDLAERAADPGLLVVMKDEPLLVTLNHDDLFRWIDQHDLSVERMQPGVGSVFGRKKADEKHSENESRENSWEAHGAVS